MENDLEIKVDAKMEAKSIPGLVKLAGDWILISDLKKKYKSFSREELYNYIEKLHSGKEESFQKVKKIYENFWRKAGDRYKEEMEMIFGERINKNKVVYIVPSLWVNIADVIGRKKCFMVATDSQAYPLDYILFHELTHLHYSDMVEKLKLRAAGWSPLMEGVDHLILFKSPIRKLFGGIKYSEYSFVKNNPEFMKEIEVAWDDRKNFKSFLKEAIKVQSKHEKEIVY